MNKQVIVQLIADEKVIFLNNIVIKRFNIISDDYAYTNATKYAKKVRKMTDKEIIKYYPEVCI